MRCGEVLGKTANIPSKSLILNLPVIRRAAICGIVIVFTLIGFYLSLIFSASKLTYEERQKVNAAIEILKEKGFTDEAFLLDHFAAFRTNDNWLNASVEKTDAYAATNFPFEIVTLYPEFFTVPQDDIERAAILLHEAKHLQGSDEKEAYEFVWRNRSQLGWTFSAYRFSSNFIDVRRQTAENVPGLFVCDSNVFRDCTETTRLQLTQAF
ncbi:MAG TPA: hypothetical protein VJL58_00140 [Pyrinomonadaceae bacterium]|nr:hypothetical protein [Pyrinomonadaceae bacterium]